MQLKASELPGVMAMSPIGGNHRFGTRPRRGTLAAEAIGTEAVRDDKRPLYSAADSGLTDLAIAGRLEPRIASA